MKNGRKKRKRETSRWKEEQRNYYSRLLHGAKKDVKKQAKIVRNFECQKIIRKIKEESNSQNDGSTKISNRQEDYQHLKSLDLLAVVEESLRRLGILHLDPKLADEVMNSDSTPGTLNEAKTEGESGDTTQTQSQKFDSADAKSLVERILKHKKMQSTLETWNQKVTVYRRWCLQQKERESGFNQSSLDNKRAKKKKAIGKADKGPTTSTDGVIAAEKCHFLRLGEAQDDRDFDDDDSNKADDEVMPHYGPGSYDLEPQKKPNRKGQRQRRAKAMAIEAKKAGRVHRAMDSVNWRRSKQTFDDGAQHQQKSSRGIATVNLGQEKTHENQTNQRTVLSTTEEKLHPSWAAAKRESSGIVKFQGTKITF